MSGGVFPTAVSHRSMPDTIIERLARDEVLFLGSLSKASRSFV
jgi:hypothetical protein